MGFYERVMGFEPTIFSLGRRHSTTKLHPRLYADYFDNYFTKKLLSYRGITSVLPLNISGLPFGSLPTLFAFAITPHLDPSPYIFSAIIKRVSPSLTS